MTTEGATTHSPKYLGLAHAVGSDLARRMQSVAEGSPYLGFGISGVFLALSELAICTRDARIVDAAVECGSRLSKQSRDITWSRGGLYNGPEGLALALLRAGELLDNTEWMECARRLLTLPRDGWMEADLYVGQMGRALVLLEAALTLGDESILDAARFEAADIATRWTTAHHAGVAIRSPAPCAFPLIGPAHGSSGLLLLAAAMHAVEQKRDWCFVYASVAEYEDQWYRRDANTWLDGRPFDVPQRPDRRLRRMISDNELAQFAEVRYAHPIAWCNGRGGIAACRLTARTLDLAIRNARQVEGAWERCLDLAKGHVDDVTLCCGFGGVADAAVTVDGDGSSAFFSRLIEVLDERWTRTGDCLVEWQRAKGRPVNSLMKGRAGVVHWLVRASCRHVRSALMPGIDVLRTHQVERRPSSLDLFQLAGRWLDEFCDRGGVVPPPATDLRASIREKSSFSGLVGSLLTSVKSKPRLREAEYLRKGANPTPRLRESVRSWYWTQEEDAVVLDKVVRCSAGVTPAASFVWADTASGPLLARFGAAETLVLGAVASKGIIGVRDLLISHGDGGARRPGP